MSSTQDWKSLLSIVKGKPEAMEKLHKLVEGKKFKSENWLAWLILKKAREQNNAPFIHHTEMLLLRRLNMDNYREFVSRCLLHGSWEFKLVLLKIFQLHRRSLHVLVKSPKTLDHVRQLLESFMEETRSRFGLELCSSDDEWDTFATEIIDE